MDFRHINDKTGRNGTPKAEINIFSKSRLGSNATFESPFRSLPSVSTPPSRFSKIINPFEHHLNERLHLPTFSPSIFAHESTPKSETKFRWTIDEISNLKPADIDEATVSQHVHIEDPHVESVVQHKINTFFSEEQIIVPSPMHTEIKPLSLLKHSSCITKSEDRVDGSTQTVLSLPPILPKHIEEVLKPYFIINEEEVSKIDEENISRKLFSFESPISSKSTHLSSDLSPGEFSPLHRIQKLKDEDEIPHLNECALSPITPRDQSRSVCRLNFSGRMSVDSSLVVPDIENPMSACTILVSHDDSYHAIMGQDVSNTTANWDMEYKHICFSPANHYDSDNMEISNTTTPSSKIFTSQRKRLSESFKNEEDFRGIESHNDLKQNRSKMFRSNTTESGYHTEGATCNEDSNWGASSFFASTPTKKELTNLDVL